ncbi:MAG: pyrroline-5-carboxylate reductase [Bacteroidota bacterium]
MKILIAGAGNMGRTYAEGFLTDHLLTKDDLTILEKNEERAKQLQAEGYTNVIHQADERIKVLDIVLLAVKPQDLPSLVEQLRPHLRADQIVLSIMAGITIETLKRELQVTKVARAMPNLPSQIGRGMTGFTASDDVDRRELFILQNLINTTGKSIYFEREGKLDAVTAISGSGPAYVFYFMEAMMKTASEMGFSRAESELLVEQTFLGAVDLIRVSKTSCTDWIKRVASRGGTTEAALKAFESRDLTSSIQEGLRAARDRAEELGR